MNSKSAFSKCNCPSDRRRAVIRATRATIVLAVFVWSAVALAQTGPNITGTLVNGVQSNVGPVGATLTIQGSGFGSTEAFSTATLNGTLLAGPGVKPISWSDTSIQAVIPNTASSGPIVVTVNAPSNQWQFAIGPVLLSVSPPSSLAGTSVTITGSGLGTSGGSVTFNGENANWTGWTDNSITATVPSQATAGPIVATVSGQASNGIPFTPTPAITQLSPPSGNAGVGVTVMGYSFGNQQGNSGVTFNGVNASVTGGWSNTSIGVTAPSGAETGNVVVTVNGFPSAGQVFTYTPSITGLIPNPVLADEPVTISGNNFGDSQSEFSGTVTFNGVPATVTNWSNQSISAIEPGNATPGPVVVTVDGVSSNGFPFSYTAAYAFNLGYAPDGDVLIANDSVNGNWTYTYDDFNRLFTSSNSALPQGFSYVYDQYGNRWYQYVTAGQGPSPQFTFSIDNQVTNKVVAASQGCNSNIPYCYDAAGNLLNDGFNSYAYDAENRIIQVNGGQTTYAYDANGQRIRKVNGAVTAEYLYDLGGDLITELSGSGAWNRGEVYAGGRHLATYNHGTTYFVQPDWLGTERSRVLLDGEQFETCINLPFGDGQTCTGGGDPSPNHFTGKERDAESGLDNFIARYDASSMGRFMTPDPGEDSGFNHMNDPQSWNGYAFARNNPGSYVDPDGRNYTVCDTNGQNCADLNNDQFNQYLQSIQGTNTTVSASGQIQYTNDNGSVTSLGTATYYNEQDIQAAQMLAQTGATLSDPRTIVGFYGASFLLGGCAIACPPAGSAALTLGRGAYYALAGLLPAVPSAIDKLQKLGVSISEANEIIESPTTQKLVDNANNGNINYIADVGGKLVRITTDPTGQRIISAGFVQARNIANSIASGRFTPQ
jgi:RHS repeat-associated protein